jgi:hypothetical protein
VQKGAKVSKNVSFSVYVSKNKKFCKNPLTKAQNGDIINKLSRSESEGQREDIIHFKLNKLFIKL